MTAAPFNIVAIKMSCPGQSTKETCLFDSYIEQYSWLSLYSAYLIRLILEPHPGRSHGGLSSLLELYDL